MIGLPEAELCPPLRVVTGGHDANTLRIGVKGKTENSEEVRQQFLMSPSPQPLATTVTHSANINLSI